VSGSGTILEAIIEADLAVSLVISDRPCRGLDIATQHGVPALLVDRRAFGGFSRDFDRASFSKSLTLALQENVIDVIAMAGFGTITSAEFHHAFPGRVLNTHPSLLPDFKGWHAVQLALDAGVAETGCTVHVATEELDDGPILAQVRVPIHPGDDVNLLQERIKEVERVVYPRVIREFMASLMA
jgi:phosphoribosylglycinamide formyltransferase-1